VARPEIVEGYTVGRWASNTYVVAARGGESAVVVDPGEDAAPLVAERLAANGLRCEAVLLTHGHLDHIWNAKAVADAAGCDAWIHPDDLWLLEDPGAALGAMGLRITVEAPDRLSSLSDGQRLSFGGLDVEVRHTPGHTPGHCVFLTDGIVFSGDVIFQGSIGRFDFPRGSLDDLMESIRRAILPLDDDVVILSGHGAETTVGIERRTNPYLIADRHGELPRLLGL
jgi:glyoxylase-like metal-dependent hydrolase (beta-lactamase superfamily II)